MRTNFFLIAQIFVDLAGRILSVHLGLGHNNDKGMFNRTGLRSWLEQHGYRVLTDRGYLHHLVVRPDDDLHSTQWNNMQKGLRSVVETVAGMVKNFGIARETSRIAPEWQEMALMICYHFTARKLNEYPLRPSLM
jgi:hypothetical protein